MHIVRSLGEIRKIVEAREALAAQAALQAAQEQRERRAANDNEVGPSYNQPQQGGIGGDNEYFQTL
jgi:hypothetical protein